VTVLADSSLWIDLWRHGNSRFATHLVQGRVVLHPFVLGELALGRVPARTQTLEDLRSLAAPRVAQHDEVLALIERASLWGRGIGWVDAHLLASALLDRAPLWTLDRRLAAVANDLRIAYAPDP
jgi:predicted nucleic acid-binding protein